MYYITWLAIASTLFVILSPLIDDVLNAQVIWILNNVFDQLEIRLWSEQLNYFIIIFAIILFMYILRYINSFVAEWTDR